MEIFVPYTLLNDIHDHEIKTKPTECFGEYRGTRFPPGANSIASCACASKACIELERLS